MKPVSETFTVEQVRQAEDSLLRSQRFPDQLMRNAAAAVARCAHTILDQQPDPQPHVVILAGRGGNGGDALYAGATLAADYRVTVLLVSGSAHQAALEACTAAGAQVSEQPIHDVIPTATLIIDGITGLGNHGGLEDSELVSAINTSGVPVLAIDVPSGVDADTGAAPAGAHIQATVTCTFGGLRQAHALTAACGRVVRADIDVDGSWLGDALNDAAEGGPHCWAQRIVDNDAPVWPAPLRPGPTAGPRSLLAIEPQPTDDKYSGGVVGVVAGSPQYPGAEVLCTLGALRGSPALVRVIGGSPAASISLCPEAVHHPDIANAGRVQAWVVGPGRGTDEAARAELATLLQRPEPVVCDADAVTLLAAHRQLRDLLRTRTAVTVLTPHAGELQRLAAALTEDGVELDSRDRFAYVHSIAEALGVVLVSKGRFTLITRPGEVISVDAGHSWSATAGSGDVLAGVLGAWLARTAAARTAAAAPPAGSTASKDFLDGKDMRAGRDAALTAVGIHALAAWLAAQTPDGPAPITASAIAAKVPQATAYATRLL